MMHFVFIITKELSGVADCGLRHKSVRSAVTLSGLGRQASREYKGMFSEGVSEVSLGVAKCNNWDSALTLTTFRYSRECCHPGRGAVTKSRFNVSMGEY